MKIIDFIKKSIDSICAKYIEENLNEILPIFYVAGSQTLPPPLSSEEEEETIKKAVRKQDKGKWNASIKKLVAQKKLDEIITGDIFNSFQSEGSCGYYYIHNSEKLNIGDTLKLMVELMNKAKAI